MKRGEEQKAVSRLQKAVSSKQIADQRWELEDNGLRTSTLAVRTSNFVLRRSLVSSSRLTVTDDLTAARAVIQIVQLSKTLAAVFVLRLNLHSTQRAVVDDERIHTLFLPWRRK